MVLDDGGTGPASDRFPFRPGSCGPPFVWFSLSRRRTETRKIAEATNRRCARPRPGESEARLLLVKRAAVGPRVTGQIARRHPHLSPAAGMVYARHVLPPQPAGAQTMWPTTPSLTLAGLYYIRLIRTSPFVIGRELAKRVALTCPTVLLGVQSFILSSHSKANWDQSVKKQVVFTTLLRLKSHRGLRISHRKNRCWITSKSSAENLEQPGQLRYFVGQARNGSSDGPS